MTRFENNANILGGCSQVEKGEISVSEAAWIQWNYNGPTWYRCIVNLEDLGPRSKASGASRKVQPQVFELLWDIIYSTGHYEVMLKHPAPPPRCLHQPASGDIRPYLNSQEMYGNAYQSLNLDLFNRWVQRTTHRSHHSARSRSCFFASSHLWAHTRGKEGDIKRTDTSGDKVDFFFFPVRSETRTQQQRFHAVDGGSEFTYAMIKILHIIYNIRNTWRNYSKINGSTHLDLIWRE